MKQTNSSGHAAAPSIQPQKFVGQGPALGRAGGVGPPPSEGTKPRSIGASDVGLAVALLLCASCSATRNSRTERPIPLRAGVVPVLSVAGEGAVEPVGGSTELELILDPATVSAALVEELRGQGFVSVELLELAGTPTDVDSVEAAVQRSATEAHVDVVIWPHVRAAAEIRTRANEKLWLNLPLFMLGGPLNWIPRDRSYLVQASLDVDVLDTRQLTSARSGSRAQARLTSRQSRTEVVELSLLDRAGYSLHHYALGVLVPGVFLARETDRAGQAVAEEVVRHLSKEVASMIRQDRENLLQGVDLVEFVPELQLSAAAEGGHRLHGSVRLESRVVDAMEELRVVETGTLYRFPEVPAIPGVAGRPPHRDYALDLHLAIDQVLAKRGVQVVMTDSVGVARSYTYQVR
jgi:hypothetical protein